MPGHLAVAADDFWACYRRLNAGKVRVHRRLPFWPTSASLVRYALGHSETLQPMSAEAVARFNLWVGREKRAGRDYSDEQMRWLALIRDHVAANVEVTLDDLQEVPSFADEGGRIAAKSPVRARQAAGVAGGAERYADWRRGGRPDWRRVRV